MELEHSTLNSNLFLLVRFIIDTRSVFLITITGRQTSLIIIVLGSASLGEQVGEFEEILSNIHDPSEKNNKLLALAIISL